MKTPTPTVFFPAAHLQKARLQTDTVADATVEELFAEHNFRQLNEWIAALVRNDQPVPAEFASSLSRYFAETSALPDWANRRKMQQGASFFARHSRPILSILGCYSLPYCYAAADGAQVLWLSQRIRNDARRRLAETAQFLLEVMDKNAFAPAGKGIRSIQKLRLIHAAVRCHVHRSGQWQDAWGAPVNQEDMAGTHLSFTYIVLDGLAKLGFYYSQEDAEAYLHLWNVIGRMLGMEEDMLPQNLKAAYWLDRRIRERHFRPSEAGAGLTKALLDCMTETVPSAMAADFLPSYMRFLLGDNVADLLAVPAGKAASIALGPIRVGNSISGLFNQFNRSPADQITDMLLDELDSTGGRTGFGVPAKLDGR
jgi:hypothetical protein